jgi:hypothetical protein
MATVRYITIDVRTNLFKPATRAFGDVAVVGAADNAATGPRKIPVSITNPDSVSHPSNVAAKDKPVDDNGWFAGDLAKSVRKIFSQSPGPTTVWAVRTDAADGANAVANALAEVGKLDVQIVVLANTPLNAGNAAAVDALADHVTTVSNTGADGKERIGVAMLAKDSADPTPIAAGKANGNFRMVMVAHRSPEDAAAAVAGTIAGYEPHISLLLKPVSLINDGNFSDSDIGTLDQGRVNWITDPVLIPGTGFYMGEGYTQGADRRYIDVVRAIDDIAFRLKAQLIQSIGSVRISRAGLRTLVSQMTGVLEPLRLREVIDLYDVFIPLLVLLDKPPATLTDVELQRIHDARVSRSVEAIVSINYAGAIHRLNIILKFQ